MEDSNEAMARSARMEAEKSFKNGKFFTAQQWMQSAATLAPDHPGNAQLVAAYDVHAAAAARRAPDCWYTVLGLPNPRDVVITYDAVKRQHRKLCLLVHPDKNPSAAAGSAFKHVQDAFDALAARHPPSASAPAPPRPPDPAPKPRPQVVQMQRPVPVSRWSQQPALASRWSQQPAPASRWSQQPVSSKSNSQKAARTPPPPPPRSQRSYVPVAGVCPACGAFTPSGGRNGRCMSCKWSLMDEPQDDGDYDEEDDYYNYD